MLQKRALGGKASVADGYRQGLHLASAEEDA
jgi:hypothetical protein